MSKVIISTRPGGFKTTVGDKQLVFPQNEPVEVPDCMVEHVMAFAPKFLDEYQAPVRKEPAKEEGGEPTVVETEQPEVKSVVEVDGTSVESLGLSNGITAKLLAEFGTVEKLTEAVDSGADLTELKGIGEEAEAKIIAALDRQ